MITKELSASIRPSFLSSDQKYGALVTLLTVNFLLLCAYVGQDNGMTNTISNSALPHCLGTSDPSSSEGFPTFLNLLTAPIATLANALGVQVQEKSRKENEKKEKT